MSLIALTVFFSLVSLLASFLILMYYVRLSYKSIPLIIRISIFLTFFLCIFPFPLLLVDIQAGLVKEKNRSPETFLKTLWYVIFWSTQMFSWVILPIAQEFETAGEFTIKSRLLRSVKENLKLYGIMGIVGAFLLSYLIFLKGIHNLSAVYALCISATNAFGLLLICVFLGSGMVLIPKILWQTASIESKLQSLYFKATDIHENLEIAAMDLLDAKKDLVSEVRIPSELQLLHASMLNSISSAYDSIPMLRTISERIPVNENDGNISTNSYISVNENSINDDSNNVNLNHLIDLNKRLKHNIKMATRANYQWEQTLTHCIFYETIIKKKRKDSGVLSFFYWNYLRFILLRVLAFLTFVLTLLIFWCELVLPFQNLINIPISVVEIAANRKSIFFSSLFLFYMVGCCYWSTFQFKLFESYRLLPYISDTTALCFIGTFLTRLILPLCYNFLWLTNLNSKKDVVVYFSNVFGDINLVDILGESFNKFTPLLIIVIAIMILTKTFNKMLSCVGIERHDPSDISSSEVLEKIENGRRLIITALRRDRRNFENFSSNYLNDIFNNVKLSNDKTKTEKSSTNDNDDGSDSKINNNIFNIFEKNAHSLNNEHGKKYAMYKAKKALLEAEKTVNKIGESEQF